jgi:hypothetical protein
VEILQAVDEEDEDEEEIVVDSVMGVVVSWNITHTVVITATGDEMVRARFSSFYGEELVV